METGQYYYRIHGRRFEICRRDALGGQAVAGEPVCFSREQARRRVRELNGRREEPCRS